MTVRNIYLVNLSFGLAGTERRFANIWRTLQRRRHVNPILVVPDVLADCLYRARLAEPGEDALWCVPESAYGRCIGRVTLTARVEMLKAFGRAWCMAQRFKLIWTRIARDPSAVVHIGLNCSSLTPPDVPLVYECVDSTLSQLGTRHYIKAAGRPCIVHCQTDRIRVALEQTLASRSPSWTTVTNPCYFASYADPQPPPRPSTPVRIAFVGRLSPEKNPHLFVDAIARARRAGVDARGLMLGEGPMCASIRRLIASLALDDVVELGFSSNPLERLKDASLFTTLQSGDNYGSQSLLEAMGAGCAVIATEVGETRRLVTADTGVLVAADAADIARAMVDLARQPERIAEMGVNAARMVRTTHTAEAYTEFLERVYERAATAHAAARLPVTAVSSDIHHIDPVSKQS